MAASMNSRHGSVSTSRSHWSRPSTTRKTTPKAREHDGRAGEPEIDDLRKRRTEYYDVPLKKPTIDPLKSDDAKKRRTSARTISQSSKASSERSRRSRKAKTSTQSAEKPRSCSRSEDDYVCRKTSSRRKTSSSSHDKRRSRLSSPPRRHSLPTALDLEVTPDDSISQVGANSRPRTEPAKLRRRLSMGRSKTYTKLAPIDEGDGEMHGSSMAQRTPSKRQSFLGALFGRRNTAPASPAARLVEPTEGDRLLDMRIPEPIQARQRRYAGDYEARNTDSNQRSTQPETRRSRRSMEDVDNLRRLRQDHIDEDLVRRMRHADLGGVDDGNDSRRRADMETWGIGNAAGHFMNDDFVQNEARVAMSSFGDANLGRRGERASGRRRKARAAPELDEPGLAPNYLGDQSVLGFGPVHCTGRYSR